MLIGGNQGLGLDLGILEHAGRVPGIGIDDDFDGDYGVGDYIGRDHISERVWV